MYRATEAEDAAQALTVSQVAIATVCCRATVSPVRGLQLCVSTEQKDGCGRQWAGAVLGS